ncbi:hypothetical protein BV25DRAFT_1572031 [Artomyces pyxidatus]|uniref:Uncharacterized protein n=1 Tax=Artomyces pyxidatus TaxID=48021 RepID=A0ACB8SKV1_9AGAM|nr:hypothetical protein BV25DRAFT_1572031 [Artomyces pyxidatus]
MMCHSILRPTSIFEYLHANVKISRIVIAHHGMIQKDRELRINGWAVFRITNMWRFTGVYG